MQYTRSKLIYSAPKKDITCTNLKLLNRSITAAGRIAPSRLTRIDRRSIERRGEGEMIKNIENTISKAQRQNRTGNAIKRSRFLALIPYNR